MSFAEDVKNELCQYEASSDADVAMKIEAISLIAYGRIYHFGDERCRWHSFGYG